MNTLTKLSQILNPPTHKARSDISLHLSVQPLYLYFFSLHILFFDNFKIFLSTCVEKEMSGRTISWSIFVFTLTPYLKRCSINICFFVDGFLFVLFVFWLFGFFFGRAVRHVGIFLPWPGIKPVPTALDCQGSPNICWMYYFILHIITLFLNFVSPRNV